MTTPRGSRPDQAGVPYICATMDLAGSLAVVTGATEGIGRATAQALGRAGSRVAICARTEANVHATVRDLKAEGIDCIGMPCDVSDPACVDAFAAFVTRERGVPQVLVNNAGIGRFRPLVDLSLEDWDATMGVNVRSLYLVTRAFLKSMLDPGTVATPFMDKRERVRPAPDRALSAEDVAHAVVATLTVSDRAMISEVDIRPTNP